MRRNGKINQGDLIEILSAIYTMLKTRNEDSLKRDSIKQSYTNPLNKLKCNFM